LPGNDGKGHEKSMCFGTTEYPWSDREAIEKAIKKYGV
jgi:UDP-N-acetylmuramoyl-L-alanyl-D-glutamate--2,6-diaminopimelate ligase